jgi:hypothetical protein
MAIKFIDGFDAYGTTNGAAPLGLTEVWSGIADIPNFTIQNGRLGSGKSLEIKRSSGTPVLTTPNLGNIATWFIGFGFKAQVAPSGTESCELREDDDSTQGVNLLMNSGGTISVRRGTTVLATSASVITAGLWHNIELKVIVHNSAGAYELKVDGVSLLSASGVDTRAGATNDYANRIRLLGPVGGANTGFLYDDFRVNDDSGSAPNNTFLGDRKVFTLFPTAEGDTNNFTPSTGTDNSAMVDESGMDSDSTYVESAVSNDRDLYGVTDMTGVTTINAIQHNIICRKTDVTDFTIEPVTKSGATTDVGGGQTVGSTSYTNKYRIQETDPDTGVAWTDGGIDAAQFGYDVG